MNFDESVFFLAIALLGNNLFDFRNAYREDGFFLQAALSVCLTARVFRSVSNALNSTFNPRFAYKLQRKAHGTALPLKLQQ